MLHNAAQTIQSFLEGFNVPAYDENTVPENAPFPRMTYGYSEDEFDKPVIIPVSIWDRSYSWARANGIAKAIKDGVPFGGILIPYEDGRIWIKRGTPFEQRLGDEDDDIRRIYINLEAEYLSVE